MLDHLSSVDTEPGTQAWWTPQLRQPRRALSSACVGRYGARLFGCQNPANIRQHDIKVSRTHIADHAANGAQRQEAENAGPLQRARMSLEFYPGVIVQNEQARVWELGVRVLNPEVSPTGDPKIDFAADAVGLREYLPNGFVGGGGRAAPRLSDPDADQYGNSVDTIHIYVSVGAGARRIALAIRHSARPPPRPRSAG
jgi:hypothetical protein